MAVGPTQILIILAVLLLLFGASRLPQLGKNLGAGIRNFKRGLSGAEEDEDEDEEAPPARAAKPAPRDGISPRVKKRRPPEPEDAEEEEDEVPPPRKRRVRDDSR